MKSERAASAISDRTPEQAAPRRTGSGRPARGAACPERTTPIPAACAIRSPAPTTHILSQNPDRIEGVDGDGEHHERRGKGGGPAPPAPAREREDAPGIKQESHDRDPRLLGDEARGVEQEAEDERGGRLGLLGARRGGLPPEVPPEEKRAQRKDEPRVLGLRLGVHPLVEPPVEKGVGRDIAARRVAPELEEDDAGGRAEAAAGTAPVPVGRARHGAAFPSALQDRADPLPGEPLEAVLQGPLDSRSRSAAPGRRRPRRCARGPPRRRRVSA